MSEVGPYDEGPEADQRVATQFARIVCPRSVLTAVVRSPATRCGVANPLLRWAHQRHPSCSLASLDGGEIPSSIRCIVPGRSHFSWSWGIESSYGRARCALLRGLRPWSGLVFE